MPENLTAANFGDLYLALDKNHDINCQLINFDIIKHNEKGNRYQDCVLWDGCDQKKVKIWEGRNGIPLAEINRNKWLTFSLSARQGTGKWKDKQFLGGFWESSVATIDSPPQAPQGVQQPAQATKAPQIAPQTKKEPNWDAIAEGKVRHGIVCAYLQSHIEPSIDRVERWVKYIITGRDPDTVPDPHPDIQTKRCEQCGALDVTQCKCTPW